jgi:iron complex transport system ATP-binding protein
MKLPNIKLDLKSVGYVYEKGGDFNFENLSLRIPENTITSLIGKNGSGKTTLLLLMMGFLKPVTGEIYFYMEGKHIPIGNSAGKIAYLPQREIVAKKYSIDEFLLLGRTPFIKNISQPSNEDYLIIEEIKTKLGIKHLGARKIIHLSGGEFQFVRIGRALAQNAEVILFDEPITHLDIGAKIKIFDLIKMLKAQGKTILFSSHDPLEAFQIADNSILIEKNKGVLFGATNEILSDENLSLCLGTSVKYKSYKGQKFLFIGK